MMRKGIGIGFILLGVLCLLVSSGFVNFNRQESKSGAEFSEILLQDVQGKMGAVAPDPKVEPNDPEEEILANTIPEIQSREMMTVPAGDYDSIGILAIPVLDVELPVLTDWSYEKLKKAPCHYYGSCYESDFVIAAHNYPSHFGRLSDLQDGDLVLFTDAVGDLHCYEVVLLETLSPTATEEMITSGFDLSLYTCTPGGNNRVTVRCSRVKGYGGTHYEEICFADFHFNGCCVFSRM